MKLNDGRKIEQTMEYYKVYVTLFITLTLCDVTYGHGGLTEPPMRSVAWKYGFDTPVNYDWMSLYCGGLNVFTQNNGTCGLCGDPYRGPYENDRGGIYDTGVIVRHYPVGLREIEVKVEMTAHHKGYFQFKLCPNNADDLTQSCLDRYPLTIREGGAQGDPTRYYPPKEPKLNELHVSLPGGIICDRCVLQWTYTAGNSIGREIQETFVNCADISIGGKLDRVPVLNKQPIEGDVVVIERGRNITDIINQSPGRSVNDVISALAGNIETSRPLTNQHRTDVTSGRGHGFPGGDRSMAGIPPMLNSRGNNNRDPRMFIPALRDGDSNLAGRASFANMDTPGHSIDGRNLGNLQMAAGFDNMGNMVDNRWMPGSPGFGQRMPTVPDAPQWNGPFFGHHFQPMIRPPSDVWMDGNNGANIGLNPNGVIDENGSHNTLLGSMNSVVSQIRKGTPSKGGNPSISNRMNSAPSEEFVRQMNDIRRVFPNSNEWIRGDGRWSHTHAVRQSPLYDTTDYSPEEIRQIVTDLPADIGPRRDISHLDDPRLNPNAMNFRNNWFPGAHLHMQQQRMRTARQRQRTQTRLPRRIEVHSMPVAQHLLRKYPQLRGRVFLSRQAHLRNTFGHMVNKYARRRNWSGL